MVQSRARDGSGEFAPFLSHRTLSLAGQQSSFVQLHARGGIEAIQGADEWERARMGDGRRKKTTRLAKRKEGRLQDRSQRPKYPVRHKYQLRSLGYYSRAGIILCSNVPSLATAPWINNHHFHPRRHALAQRHKKFAKRISHTPTRTVGASSETLGCTRASPASVIRDSLQE